VSDDAVIVALVPIDRENVAAVCDLAVREDQRRLVAPAAQTIAEAKCYEPGAFLRAIEADGEPVGVLWVQTDEPVPYLVRFMVDAGAQGRGIGRQAVALLLDEMRAAGHRELELSYVPAEGGAERFWLGCGFEPTGRMHEDEVLVRMDL
jgi:diamine N-acetyltransferase